MPLKTHKIKAKTFGMVVLDLKLPIGNKKNSTKRCTKSCIIMFGYNNKTAGWYNPETDHFEDILEFPEDELK
jgi:hypothetical protein